MAGIGVDRLGAAADELAARDPSVLRLENLDTDVPPPAAAVAATRERAGADDANSYLPFVGQARLRRGIAALVTRCAGIPIDWSSQVIVTAGGLNGLLVTLLAVLDPGDEVILTDPTYVGMINRVWLAGGVPRLVPFTPGTDGWRLDLDALRRAVSPRTRAFCVMSPSMPSGAVLDRAEWQAVADACRETDAWLLYNAAMERIVYDGRPLIQPASLPGMAERTITVGSVSKEYRMIGWRVGWVVGPAPVMRDVALVAISDVVTPVGIAQQAAAAAVEGPDDDVRRAVREWERRRDALVEELDGLPVVRPHGGWSLLLRTANHGLSGEAASQRLLERGRIAATPMTGWGDAHGADYVRFVFSNEPVERLEGIGARVRRAMGV
jgi:aspartate/methionine/tyrosine aminotransferase